MHARTLFRLLQAATLLLCSLNLAHAGEPLAEPLLRISPGMHTSQINGIATDKSGRWLVTAAADATAKVWDTTTGYLQRTLHPYIKGKARLIFDVAISPNGKTVALASGSVYLFDRSSGKLLRRLPLEDACHVAFSPDGNTIAAVSQAEYVPQRKGHGLHLFSIINGRKIAEDIDYGDYAASVDFSSDGRLITTSYDGLLRLYRFDGDGLSLLVKRAVLGGKNPYGARFSPDSKRIAVGFNDTQAVNVLNGSDLSLEYAPDTSGVDRKLLNVAWSRDGSTLFAAGEAHRLYDGHWNTIIRSWKKAGRGAPVDWAVARTTIFGIVALPKGQLAFGGGAPDLGVLNSEGKTQFYKAPSVADFRVMKESFTLSFDASKVHFGYEYGGTVATVFDINSRSFITENTPSLAPPLLSTSGLDIAGWENTYRFTLNGTSYQPNYGLIRSLAMLSNGEGFVVGTDNSLIFYDNQGKERWLSLRGSGVWAVNISQDGRWIVAAYHDGTIRWHRTSDGVEQLAFYPHPDKKLWVMWTPSGYYDASPGAEELVGWHVNNGEDHEADFFPASRFRERFFRPDVLAKVLETQDEARAVQLANAESGRRTQTITSIAQVLPPVVEIVSPAGDSTVQSGKITVRYTVRTAADAPVTAMRVRVNGLLQSDTRALKLVKRNDESQEIEVTIPEPGAGIQSTMRALKLSGKGKAQESDAEPLSQEVEIQLFAENKFSTSTPAILRLQVAGGKATPKQAASSKPKLYVLAVGVSKYKNPEYNLGLAAKDAQDFVNSLSKQKGKLYSDVVVKLLTDDKATKDDVLEGLDWLKQQVTSNDVGIMFVAGHGMNDKLGNYYFLPHNANPEQLIRTGVSQNDIKQTFASLPGHTVFFIDTCYSGGVMGNVRTSGFVNDLASAENGAVVFTASSAGQLSQENSAWGNGAFTKSVVEGLSGSADFRKSGFITAKGLDYYVDDRVKTLTNGQQTPVSISPGGVTDFPIAVVGK
ncbi:MAG: caspase family protein [Gallionellaceae bacterium]